MHRPLVFGLLLSAPLFPLFGCGDASPPEDRIVRTDSAGVEIVRADAPRLDDPEAWRVAEEPFLEVGGLDEPEQELFRVTYVAPGGEVLATTSLVPAARGRGATLVGRLPGRGYLARDATNPFHLDVGSGIVWGEGWVVRTDREGRPLEDVLAFPDAESFVLDGSLHRIVRRAFEPRRVTTDETREWREGAFQVFPTEVRRLAEAALEFPDHHPVFKDLQVSRDGHVWVENDRSPEAEGRTAWTVFDEDGDWVTDVEVPEELEVLEIGADYLIGVRTDEFDVEFLAVYEVKR